jgi:hypothetical protein
MIQMIGKALSLWVSSDAGAPILLAKPSRMLTLNGIERIGSIKSIALGDNSTRGPVCPPRAPW